MDHKHEYFENLKAARLSVFKYIETFYNTQRLHQSLGYKSPTEFETAYAPVTPPLSESPGLSHSTPTLAS